MKHRVHRDRIVRERRVRGQEWGGPPGHPTAKRCVRREALILGILAVLSLTACGRRNTVPAPPPPQASPVAFGEVVIAAGVGPDNSPTAVAKTFGPLQEAIYIVAVAKRIDPGTRLFARFTHEGQLLQDTAEVIANRTYTDAFVEFHLPRPGERWPLGQFAAQIFVNGAGGPSENFRVEEIGVP